MFSLLLLTRIHTQRYTVFKFIRKEDELIAAGFLFLSVSSGSAQAARSLNRHRQYRLSAAGQAPGGLFLASVSFMYRRKRLPYTRWYRKTISLWRLRFPSCRHSTRILSNWRKVGNAMVYFRWAYCCAASGAVRHDKTRSTKQPEQRSFAISSRKNEGCSNERPALRRVYLLCAGISFPV